jgi:hypothetical protein
MKRRFPSPTSSVVRLPTLSTQHWDGVPTPLTRARMGDPKVLPAPATRLATAAGRLLRPDGEHDDPAQRPPTHNSQSNSPTLSDSADVLPLASTAFTK